MTTHSKPQIPQLPPRQDSLDAQLRDVITLANRVGCYDAADLISRQFFPEEPIERAPLVGCRVYAYNPKTQGVVIEEPSPSSPSVCVQWDDGEATWSRRDLLHLVGEWS